VPEKWGRGVDVVEDVDVVDEVGVERGGWLVVGV
jgi:hypothetical protein